MARCKKCGYDNKKPLGRAMSNLKKNQDIKINLKDFSSRELKLSKNGKKYFVHKLICDENVIQEMPVR